MLKILSYPRTILATLVLPFFMLGISLTIIICNLILNSRRLDDFFMTSWGRFSCWIFGVHIECNGIKNIPAGGCLFVFNHTSFFDIFAMAASLEGLRFGAKIELFDIPIFGLAMRRIGILPIARNRREEVFKIYRSAEARIKNGERFALAPEGTRQASETLGTFKSGPFVFAINAKAPVVPVVILNAGKILPKGHFLPNWGTWKNTVRLEVLTPISTQGFTTDDRPILQEKARNAMLPFFQESLV